MERRFRQRRLQLKGGLLTAPQTTPVFAEARRGQSFPGAVGANETTYGGNIPSIRPDLA